MKKVEIVYPKVFKEDCEILFKIDDEIINGIIQKKLGRDKYYIFLLKKVNNFIFTYLGLNDPEFFNSLGISLDFRAFKWGAWPEANSYDDLYKTLKVLESTDEF